MKRRFLLGPVISIFLSISNLWAGDGGRDERWMAGLYGKDCIPLMDLSLSEEQRTAILEKERSFREKMMVLRIDLIKKIFEFRAMLRDPEVGETEIVDRAREVETVKADIQEERLKYYLEIRRILSRDQIRTVCPPLDKAFIRERERRPPLDRTSRKEHERRP